MMYRQLSAACLAIFLFISIANAQKAAVTVSLNESFFDALLDSIYQNFDAPEFPLAHHNIYRRDAGTQSLNGVDASKLRTSLLASSASRRLGGDNSVCNESVKILREINGLRTAVRFREGKIYVPLAFSGNYAPPFVGCIEFSGWAESNIDLEYDQPGQRLIGRLHVLNVNLGGAGGLGGTVIAKLLQRTIDKKLNPVEIMRLDKLSFSVPIQNSGNIRMKAVGVRPEISNGLLNIHIAYEFLKV